MAYHNPDETPDIEQKEKSILIRFRTREDYEKFIEKTGIYVDPKTNSINFSQMNALDDIFG